MKHWVRSVLEEAVSQERNLTQVTWASLKRIIELLETNEVYQFLSKDMDRLADDLSVCDDLTNLSEIMWNVAVSSGFQNFAIFALSHGSGTTFKSRVCTSYNKHWIRNYEEKRYQYVDPIMHMASSMTEGFFFYSDLDHDTPAIRDFWNDARNHKIGRNGICHVIALRDGVRIGVSFSTSSNAAKVRKDADLTGSDLAFIAQLAAECFCFTSRGPAISNDVLSTDELRFLHLLATLEDPEEALKVTACYGSNKALQAAIRSKLNVTSVFQALALASRRGWFDQLPYISVEVETPFPPLRGLNSGMEMPTEVEG
ncbi:MAG: autoinducer binding domain-containing protein [Halioglobus sp.]